MLTVDLKRFDLQAGEFVLDLGCGEGRHVNSFFWLKPVHAVGVDLSFNDISVAQQRMKALIEDEQFSTQGLSVSYLVANGMRLPFADESFDKIICSEVLEHIPDYQSVIDEMTRILKPGGQLCVSVPRYWPEKICWMLSDEYHANEGGHIRIFKTSQLKSAITQRGFKFESRHWAHALHSPFWWLKCLFWKTQETNWLIKKYHQLLVWDLMKSPKTTHYLEKIMNPVFGKSVVLYFNKPSRQK